MPAACYHHAVGNIQVKDVPEDVHDELRRRATARHMTIRDYVLELLRRDQATPSLEAWLATVAQRDPVEVDAADLIRTARDQRGRDITDRL